MEALAMRSRRILGGHSFLSSLADHPEGALSPSLPVSVGVIADFTGDTIHTGCLSKSFGSSHSSADKVTVQGDGGGSVWEGMCM